MPTTMPPKTWKLYADPSSWYSKRTAFILTQYLENCGINKNDEDVENIMSMINLFKKLNFYSYNTEGEGVFDNNKDNKIECRFCKKVNVIHKSFGNHIKCCPWAQTHRLIREVGFTIIRNCDDYVTDMIDILNKYNYTTYINKDKDIRYIKQELQQYEYYNFHLNADEFFMNNIKNKWKDNLKMWKSKIERNTLWLQKIGSMKYKFEKEWKELENNKNYINKYFDESIWNIIKEEKMKPTNGIHYQVEEIITNGLKSYNNIFQTLISQIDNVKDIIQELYEKDILKIQLEQGECGVCMCEKLVRKTTCCRQVLCNDCSTQLKDGAGTNTNCPFCRNNGDW